VTGFDAVILAGGRGERLEGVDKAAVVVDGITLLDRVVAAAAEATQVICVGPERETSRPVHWTREQPPGGGPVSALAAGLELVEAPVVVVLAVDLPFVTSDLVSSLVEGCSSADATLAEDGAGIHQPLLAAYRLEALRGRLQSLGDPAGESMKNLIERLDHVTLKAPGAAQDVDSPEDIDRLGITPPRRTVR
jgi:molybdopterin-guanine dinucleotide biosynthesis protein A